MGLTRTIRCDRPDCASTTEAWCPTGKPFDETAWAERAGWAIEGSTADPWTARYACPNCQKGYARDQIQAVEGAKLAMDFLREFDGQGFYMTECLNQGDSQARPHELDCHWHVHNADTESVDEGVRAQVLQSGYSYRAKVIAPDGQVLIEWDDEVWG